MRAAALLVLLMVAQGCFLDRAGTGAVRDGGGFDASLDAAAIQDGSADEDSSVDDAGTPCVPTGPDVCNGIDDDCDPESADGSEDMRVDVPCDDPIDLDMCAGGTVRCATGVRVCEDDDGDLEKEIEVCDGSDNDCNPDTPDGSAESRVGAACDDPDDADLCPDGLGLCDGGAFLCDPSIPTPTVEVCDGVDNDCNAATLDGSADPELGDACDHTDLDLCENGTLSCVGGALACGGDGGDLPSEIERCDGIDNDCNPATLDGAAEPGLGVACDGTDTDECLGGVTACLSTGVQCNDDATSSVETCNGVDDDCDGDIDVGAGCPCTLSEFGGHAYLQCDDFDDRLEWTDARAFCRAIGYQLVTINNAAEQAFLAASATSNGGYWIGANDRTTEGTFIWSADNSALTFTNWRNNEPNDFFGEDCAQSDRSANGTVGAGGWNDTDCADDLRYFCESP